MVLAIADARVDHSAFRRVPAVSEWERELARRSKLTASIRVRSLALFCHRVRLTSGDVVTIAKRSPERFRRLMSDYASALEGAGRKAAYTAKTFDAVRSWLEFRGVRNDRLWPPVSSVRNETVEGESAPGPEEVRTLLGALGPRGRVIVLLMAQSGVRPGAIGSMDGTDGLTLGSLPELDLETLEFEKVPAVLIVGSKLSKNRKTYTTFVGVEGCDAIRIMLEERRSRLGAGPLSPSDPLIASQGAGVGKTGSGPKGIGAFVTTKSLTSEVRRAARRVALHFRPYALRSSFSTNLFIAETRGMMVREAREAMMGHDLGASGRYNLSKKLNPALLEELRALYSHAYPYLSTAQVTSTSDDELRRLFVREFLGFDDVEITKMGVLTNDKIRTLVEAKKRDEDGAAESPPPGSQRVVEIGAVEAYISKGWRFVAPLNGSKAVIQAPES